MKVKYQIDDKQIEDMDLTISMTMPVKEWRELMRVIPTKWPGWSVSNSISTALGEIARATEKVFEDPCS